MATNVDISVFLFFATTAAVVFCEDYQVVISTEPASGPYLVNREIEFTCHVDPAPPEPVTYSWHAVKEANGATTLRSQSSVNRTSYTPQYRDLHVSCFFCKVFSNGIQVGVGRKCVKFHGVIFSERPPAQCFNFGDTLKLHINVSNDSLATYIRTLTWYHNSTQVTNSIRVMVQNQGRNIVIQNARSEDAGTYQVEVTSLNLRGSSCCDLTWFYFLKNHAAYAPVTITVSKMGSAKCNYYDVVDSEEQPMHFYPLITEGSSISLLIQDNETLTNNHFLRATITYVLRHDYVDKSLSVNGTTLSSNQEKFNHSFMINSNYLLRKEINYRYNSFDEGFYIYLPYAHVHGIYIGLVYDYICQCDNYYSHVRTHMGTSYMSFHPFYFILRTYKQPSVKISSYHNTETDGAELVCSTYGGVPEKQNITLRQQGVSTTENSLQIELNRFGEYSCTVESLYNITSVVSSIKDKASFQLQLLSVKNFSTQQCLQLKEMENTSNSLVENITNTLKVFCNCTDSINIFNLSVDCSTSGNLLVRGVIIGGEGDVSASLLVDMLQVWLLTTKEKINVTFGHELFTINKQCPPRVNLASPDLCDKLYIDVHTVQVDCEKEPTSMSTSGAVIGGSMVGGMILGVLGCMLILCIGICILKLKNDMGMRGAASESTTTKEQEVVMGSNAAYETVELRYQLPSSSRARSQPRARGQHIENDSEPVYECPAS